MGLEHSYLLQLCKADFCLKVGELVEAENILSRLPDCLSPEMMMLRASLLSRQGNEYAAIKLLLSQPHRCPRHVGYYRQLLNHMIEGKDAVNIMPCAHEALSKFGNILKFSIITTLNLYNRQPGLAKFCAAPADFCKYSAHINQHWQPVGDLRDEWAGGLDPILKFQNY